MKHPRSRRRSRLTVARATLRDIDTLVQQRRAMWEDLGIYNRDILDRADRVYKPWAKTRLRRGELRAWVVRNRDSVAGGGCLWLQPVQPRPRSPMKVQPYLLSMYTDPKFRRRGVASMVVQEAIDWCRKNGYHRLMLHASDMGRKVYRNFGFHRTWEMRLDVPGSRASRASRLGERHRL